MSIFTIHYMEGSARILANHRICSDFNIKLDNYMVLYDDQIQEEIDYMDYLILTHNDIHFTTSFKRRRKFDTTVKFNSEYLYFSDSSYRKSQIKAFRYITNSYRKPGWENAFRKLKSEFIRDKKKHIFEHPEYI